MTKFNRVIASAAASAIAVGVFMPTASALTNYTFAEPDDSITNALAVVNTTVSADKNISCLGILVDSEWVMTAAQCIGEEDNYIDNAGTNNVIASGSSSLSSSPVPSSPSPGGNNGGEDNFDLDIRVRIGSDFTDDTYEVIDAQTHPEGKDTHDIVLLKLDRDVENSPVELNPETVTTEGTATRTYDWRLPNTRYASGVYADGTTTHENGQLTTTFENNSELEVGDSGAPIIDTEGKLVGIQNAKAPNNQAIGTAVSDTYNWINSVTK